MPDRFSLCVITGWAIDLDDSVVLHWNVIKAWMDPARSCQGSGDYDLTCPFSHVKYFTFKGENSRSLSVLKSKTFFLKTWHFEYKVVNNVDS